MRRTWLILALLGAASIGVASCAKPPPPKIAAPSPPPPAPPPAPKPHKPKVAALRAPVAAQWQFNAADCSATATSRALSLDISVSARQVALAVRSGARFALRAKGTAPIEFTGAQGSWTLDGAVTGQHRMSAMQPMSDHTGSQILVLVEGGTVKFGGSAASLPRLLVPNGGAPGRAWFDCVRARLGP